MIKVKDKGYSIFVASDISIVTPDVMGFYRQVREVCERCGKSSFLPLDFTGTSRFDVGISDAEVYKLISDKINHAELGVFYLGFNSYDVGVMLAKAKQVGLPLIFMYESDKEDWLRENEPKVWWRLKTRDELSLSPPCSPVTPTSYNSFMMPETTYSKIVAEIKFKDKKDGLSELEEKIRKFFIFLSFLLKKIKNQAFDTSTSCLNSFSSSSRLVSSGISHW